MAIVEVKVPQLSESVSEATMLTWKKKAGEAVAIDEILIEIETDKVVLEVPAPAAGVLAEIDRKSTRLNSSHQIISYAVFCLKKKNITCVAPSASRMSTTCAA